MNIHDVRRQRLRNWLEGKAAPQKEKSYFSQLMSGTAAFGERAARRLERDYGMGTGYLDQPFPLGEAPKKHQQEPLFDRSIPVITSHSDASPKSAETGNVSDAPHYSLDKNDFRPVYVIEWPQGGMPERLWTDGEHPVGVTDRFAVLATTDPRAFLAPIIGTAMVPRFNPGEFALVEPGIDPELEDDVLVRLNTGETLLRRLVSRRGGVQLAAYNEPGTALYPEADISWMFCVAHTVPARMVRQR